MTEMAAFSEMDIEQRQRCTFIPLGSHIYNGLGYMMGPRSPSWDTIEKRQAFYDWAEENGVKYDGAVYEFPDVGTYIMARMLFE